MPGHNPNPSKRGNISGWSAGAVRRHTQFLRSVDIGALTGYGYAVTLTLKTCPPTSDALHAMIRAYLMRLDRLGAVRVHWLVEWQRRGVPHLHLAVYFVNPLELTRFRAESVESRALRKSLPRTHPLEPFAPQFVPRDRADSLITPWLDIALPFGAERSAQTAEVIDGPKGWIKYLSKHASRGVKHYQRQGKPAGWEKTGRLWGRTGSWPVWPPLVFTVDSPAYWRYRRLVRGLRIADARKSGDWQRVKLARRMLACPEPKLSAVRGVSEWSPGDQPLEYLRFVDLLASEGFLVLQRD